MSERIFDNTISGNNALFGKGGGLWMSRRDEDSDPEVFANLGHVTGDIAIHEMAYSGEELWFVNT
jgi:hypothetical protein